MSCCVKLSVKLDECTDNVNKQIVLVRGCCKGASYFEGMLVGKIASVLWINFFNTVMCFGVTVCRQCHCHGGTHKWIQSASCEIPHHMIYCEYLMAQDLEPERLTHYFQFSVKLVLQ